MNGLNEILMCALYAGVFSGSWLLGRKKRAGWLAMMAGGVAGVALNVHLGIVTGVLFGAINLVLYARGFNRWGRNE